MVVKQSVIGYFGYQNFGDDLMLKAYMNELEKNSRLQITLYTREVCSGVSKCKNGFKIKICFSNFINYLLLPFRNEIGSTIVWVGGTCIYSDSSDKLGKGMLWLYYIGLISRILGKRLILFNIGINHIENIWHRFIAKKILTLSSIRVIVRDHSSVENAQDLCQYKKIKIGGDLALLHSTTATDDPVVRNTVVIAPHGNFVNDYLVNFKKIVNMVDELGLTPVFVGLHAGDLDDIKVAFDNSPITPRMVEYDGRNLHEVVGEISSSALVIGMRLHSLVTAQLFGVRYIGLAYDQKIFQFCERMSSKDFCFSIGKEFDLRTIAIRLKHSFEIPPALEKEIQSVMKSFAMLEDNEK